ncbi:MAG: hypothetical protein FJ255_12355 [Phycisphaerae bacterium]|nr:hypothetical protein [Phycisphaerae bacterium]
MVEWSSGRVVEWSSGRVGEWASGRVGEWASGGVAGGGGQAGRLSHRGLGAEGACLVPGSRWHVHEWSPWVDRRRAADPPGSTACSPLRLPESEAIVKGNPPGAGGGGGGGSAPRFDVGRGVATMTSRRGLGVRAGRRVAGRGLRPLPSEAGSPP